MPVKATHVGWGTSSEREALIRNAWLDLRRNLATHEREIAQAEELGYKAIENMPPLTWEPPAVRSFDVLPTATGMGPACPFRTGSGVEKREREREGVVSGESLPLVFETKSPIASKEECQMMIDETAAYIAAGNDAFGSGFTLATTNRNIAVVDLPKTLAWLNSQGLPRVASLFGRCYSAEAIGDPAQLRIYRALVVQYDAADGYINKISTN